MTTEKNDIGSVEVSRTWKNGKAIVDEQNDEEKIEVQTLHDKARIARVSFGGRMTVNMGNFESIQVSVGIELPCYVEEIPDAYLAVKDMVDQRLNREIEDCRAVRQQKRKQTSPEEL